MSKSFVTCVQCKKETEISATVDGKIYCPGCVPIDFIKARRATRKDSYNGQRVRSLEERRDKAMQTAAYYEDKLVKAHNRVTKVEEYLAKANDRASDLAEKIADTKDALESAAAQQEVNETETE